MHASRQRLYLVLIVMFFCLGAERLNADLIYNLVDHGLASHSLTGYVQVTDTAPDDGVLELNEITGWEVNVNGPLVSFSTRNTNPGAFISARRLLIDEGSIRLAAQPSPNTDSDFRYNETQSDGSVFRYEDINGFQNQPFSNIRYAIDDDSVLGQPSATQIETEGPGVERVHATRAVPAQTITHVPLFTFDGDDVGDFFGNSVSGAGDVNGDGTPDLIVGAVLDDNNGLDSGSARVLSGSDGSVLYNFDGDSSGDQFGESVSGAGDVNGDGTPDLIVGAFFDDNNGAASGSARVLSGIDGSVLYEFNGDGPIDFFGVSVSGAGDINGDGTPDLIVGAHFDRNGTGFARVFSGSDGRVLHTVNGDSERDNFGESVSGAGDVNEDGFDDFIVGAPGDILRISIVGYARVFSGFDGSVLYHFNGDSVEDRFGQSVSSVGDVNGDGTPDLIVGASGDDNNGFNSGSARVLSGRDGSILYNFNGDSNNDRFGNSVSGAGDVNGDGLDDFIVGAPGDNINGGDSGSVRVFSGSDGSILYTFNGDSRRNNFGGSVSGAGDINGDGLDDFIVGAFGGFSPDEDESSGYARVFVSQLPIPGDFDTDLDVDGDDVDFYIGNLNQPATGELAQLDLNGDGDVTIADHDLHVTTLVVTSNGVTGALLGDVNLDGVVDVLSDGFALVGSLGQSVTSRSQGDLNADGMVDVLNDAFILVGQLGLTNAP